MGIYATNSELFGVLADHFMLATTVEADLPAIFVDDQRDEWGLDKIG
jgi:hypothetical protein